MHKQRQSADFFYLWKLYMPKLLLIKILWNFLFTSPRNKNKIDVAFAKLKIFKKQWKHLGSFEKKYITTLVRFEPRIPARKTQMLPLH